MKISRSLGMEQITDELNRLTSFVNEGQEESTSRVEELLLNLDPNNLQGGYSIEEFDILAPCFANLKHACKDRGLGKTSEKIQSFIASWESRSFPEHAPAPTLFPTIEKSVNKAEEEKPTAAPEDKVLSLKYCVINGPFLLGIKEIAKIFSSLLISCPRDLDMGLLTVTMPHITKITIEDYPFMTKENIKEIIGMKEHLKNLALVNCEITPEMECKIREKMRLDSLDIRN